MWTKSFSKEYKGIKKEDVWKIWQDVNHYSVWHSDLDYCKLDGNFQVGNFFRLKAKGAPEVKVHLLKIHENKSFLDVTHFPGAKMYDNHEITETNEGLRISSTISVKGLLAFLWIHLVAKNMAASVPHEIENMVDLIRKRTQ